MIKWEPEDISVYQKQIDDLLEAWMCDDIELSDWEQKFLDDLQTKRINKDINLTEGQAEKLEELYEGKLK